MIYAVVKAELAERAGFPQFTHRVLGDVMILNENELRNIDGDIGEAANKLGGVTMTHNELQNYINDRL